MDPDRCGTCLAAGFAHYIPVIVVIYAGVSEWFDTAYADRPLLIRICKMFLHLLWMGKHAPGYLLRHLRKWCRQS